MVTRNRIRITLDNGFRYAGSILSEDLNFLTLLDDKTGNEVIVRIDRIESKEVLS